MWWVYAAVPALAVHEWAHRTVARMVGGDATIHWREHTVEFDFTGVTPGRALFALFAPSILGLPILGGLLLWGTMTLSWPLPMGERVLVYWIGANVALFACPSPSDVSASLPVVAYVKATGSSQ